MKKRKMRKRAAPEQETDTAPEPDPQTAPAHPVLLDKASLSVYEVADDEPRRYCADHVHVEQDGTTVATNGRLMLAVEPTKDNPDDLPVGLEPVNVPPEGIDIDAATCKSVVANLRSPHIPILANAVITRCDDLVELSSSVDLKHVKREGNTKPELGFPPWREMAARPVPTEDAPVAQIGLRLDVLEQLVKALKKMTADMADDSPFVRFTFGATGHILRDGDVGNDRRFIGMTGRMGPKYEDHNLTDLNDWQNAILDYVGEEKDDEETQDADDADSTPE